MSTETSDRFPLAAKPTQTIYAAAKDKGTANRRNIQKPSPFEGKVAVRLDELTDEVV